MLSGDQGSRQFLCFDQQGRQMRPKILRIKIGLADRGHAARPT
jgi:hypothetical protein